MMTEKTENRPSVKLQLTLSDGRQIEAIANLKRDPTQQEEFEVSIALLEGMTAFCRDELEAKG